jgi:hypothetical protein
VVLRDLIEFVAVNEQIAPAVGGGVDVVMEQPDVADMTGLRQIGVGAGMGGEQAICR